MVGLWSPKPPTWVRFLHSVLGTTLSKVHLIRVRVFALLADTWECISLKSRSSRFDS